MSAEAIAATLFGAMDLRIVPRDPGPLAPGIVRVAFGAGGICGSDMHYFQHGRTGDFVVTSPLVLGHEIAGTIVAINAEAPGLAIGQRVAVNPSRWCGTCPQCARGRKNLCENIYFMGSASKTPHMQGGFAAFFDAVPAQCVPVPDHVSMRAAALAEPLAVSLHAVRRAGVISGRRVLVLGAGPIGLLTLLAVLREKPGASAIADLSRTRLDFALSLGADEAFDLSAGTDILKTADPFDIVFEATGAPAGVASAIAAVRRGGRVVQIGNLPGGAIPVPANQIMAKEVDFLGSFRFGDEFSEAVALISSGAIDVTRIITGERPLAAAPEALQLALDRATSIKVMLVSGK